MTITPIIPAVAESPSPPRTKRRRTRPGGYAPEELRRSLLESAVKLFHEQGYAETSVHEIVSAAGVTKGALYHHFESKEDILREIHDEFVDYELAAMRRVLEEHSDPAVQLRELLREFLYSVELYLASVTVFVQERRYLTGERFEAVKGKRDEFDQLFLGVIERGMRMGVFRDDLDARVVSFGILGMCSHTHQWFEPGGKRSSAEIAAMFADMAINGLLAP